MQQMMENLKSSFYKSCYGTFFGRKPDLTDYKDVNILKIKKFSQLDCSFVLNKQMVKALDTWQMTKEHPDYLGMALYTIKSLHTFFKRFQPTESTQRTSYRRTRSEDFVKSERFDSIINRVVKEFHQIHSKKVEDKKQQPFSVSKTPIVSKRMAFIPPQKSNKFLKTN
jgi:hypothetical protein